MYKPPFFDETRPEKIEELLTDNPFATLISVREGTPIISHLPFLLSRVEASTILLSHMAKANGHWKEFEINSEVVVIFQGPHAYISPACYPPAPSNVPTWNYTVVHASGTAHVIADLDRAWEVMNALIKSNENKYGSGWSPEKKNLETLLQQIVVFEVRISTLDGKFKLSQQQKLDVRQRAANGLMKSSIQSCQEVGKMMLDLDL